MAGKWEGGWWWRGGGDGGNGGRWSDDDDGRGCGTKGDGNDVEWHGRDAEPTPHDFFFHRGSGVLRELPHVVTVEYIQSLESTHQKFMLNNVALKWIRDTHESPPGVPSVAFVNLNDYHTEGLQIGIIGRVKE